MVTRAQISSIADRIDALADRFAPPMPKPERWVINGDQCYRLDAPEHVISVAELEARPCPRIERIIVDPTPQEAA
jgi:hypothetical protein